MRPRPAQQGPETGSNGAGRDRDDSGRPRNARPRDRLGRPLARDSQGDPAGPQPATAGAALSPEQAVRTAQRLLDEGRPFHAHEVFEDSWRSAPPAERDLWQGLAQLAVGLTHALRGNAAGAVALLRRGADRLAGYSGAAVHDIDLAEVVGSARQLAGRIEQDGLAAIPPAALSLPLRGEPGGDQVR